MGPKNKHSNNHCTAVGNSRNAEIYGVAASFYKCLKNIPISNFRNDATTP